MIRENKKNHFLVEFIVLAIIVAIGIFLRFCNLAVTPGWWPDEGVMLNIANNAVHGKMQMFSLTYPFVPHPPVYFYIAGLWMKIFGVSILAVRALSATIGVVSIILVYGITKKLGSRFSATISALVFACFPAILIDDRIGLSYPLLALFMLLSVYYYLKFSESKKPLFILLSALFAGLCPITSYAGIVLSIIIFLLIIINVKKVGYSAFWATILLFLPFLTYLYAVGMVDAPAVVHDLKYMLNERPENAKPAIENIVNGAKSMYNANGILTFGIIGLLLAKNRNKYIVVIIAIAIALTEFKTRGYWWYISTYFPLLIVGIGLLFGYARNLMTKLRIPNILTALIIFAIAIYIFFPYFRKSFVTVYNGNSFGLSEERIFAPQNQTKLKNAISYINSHTDSDDVVMSSAHLTWMIDAMPSDPVQAYVYAGNATTNFPDDMYSTGRFVYDVSLENTKYFLDDNFVKNWFAFQPGIKENITSKIYENWTKVFDNGEFKVYLNTETETEQKTKSNSSQNSEAL